MDIKTKFKVGDFVYTIVESKIRKAFIIEIKVHVKLTNIIEAKSAKRHLKDIEAESSAAVKYVAQLVDGAGETMTFGNKIDKNESLLFSTKEEAAVYWLDQQSEIDKSKVLQTFFDKSRQEEEEA